MTNQIFACNPILQGWNSKATSMSLQLQLSLHLYIYKTYFYRIERMSSNNQTHSTESPCYEIFCRTYWFWTRHRKCTFD